MTVCACLWLLAHYSVCASVYLCAFEWLGVWLYVFLFFFGVCLCFESTEKAQILFFSPLACCEAWTMSLCIHCASVCLHMVYNGRYHQGLLQATCSYHQVPSSSVFLLRRVIEIQVVLCRSGGSLWGLCQSCRDGRKTVVTKCCFDIYNFNILQVSPEIVILINIFEARSCVLSGMS